MCRSFIRKKFQLFEELFINTSLGHSNLYTLSIFRIYISPRYIPNSRYDTSGPLYERYKSDYVKLYIDTIRNIILDDDYTRPFLSSSPSNGKVTEENGWISEDPKPSSPHYGDSK